MHPIRTFVDDTATTARLVKPITDIVGVRLSTGETPAREYELAPVSGLMRRTFWAVHPRLGIMSSGIASTTELEDICAPPGAD